MGKLDKLIARFLPPPHPRPIVKSYVIEQVLEHLKERGKLK